MFKANTGMMGATEPGQRVTASNIEQLPAGSVVRNGDGSRLIHLHDTLWLWCSDGAWCYDTVKNLSRRLDEQSVACHVVPTAREPVMVAEARKPCGDTDCTCHVPTFTDPLQALRFLSGRFKFAGVDHAVAVEYARDIDAILATVPAKVTEASKVLELAEAYRVTCGGRCANWINPCADYETAEYLSAYAAILAAVQPAEPVPFPLQSLVPGITYESPTHGSATYIGPDDYMGQRTYKFKTPYGTAHFLPEVLPQSIRISPQPAEPGACPHCDGSGDVNRADGEWLGYCSCAAGVELKAQEGGR